MNILNHLTNLYNRAGEEKDHNDKQAEKGKKEGGGGGELQKEMHANGPEQQKLQCIKGEDRMKKMGQYQQPGGEREGGGGGEKGWRERWGWRKGEEQCYISVAVLCRSTTVLHINCYQRECDVGSAGFFQSRQILVCTLPVNCSCPEEKWTLASTAFILDRGQFPQHLSCTNLVPPPHHHPPHTHTFTSTVFIMDRGHFPSALVML